MTGLTFSPFEICTSFGSSLDRHFIQPTCKTTAFDTSSSTHLAIHTRYISPVPVLSLCQTWGSPVGETLSSFSSLPFPFTLYFILSQMSCLSTPPPPPLPPDQLKADHPSFLFHCVHWSKTVSFYLRQNLSVFGVTEWLSSISELWSGKPTWSNSSLAGRSQFLEPCHSAFEVCPGLLVRIKTTSECQPCFPGCVWTNSACHFVSCLPLKTLLTCSTVMLG